MRENFVTHPDEFTKETKGVSKAYYNVTVEEIKERLEESELAKPETLLAFDSKEISKKLTKKVLFDHSLSYFFITNF